MGKVSILLCFHTCALGHICWYPPTTQIRTPKIQKNTFRKLCIKNAIKLKSQFWDYPSLKFNPMHMVIYVCFRTSASPPPSLPWPQDVHLVKLDTSTSKNGTKFYLSFSQFTHFRRSSLGSCPKFKFITHDGQH
jgi:hypothetical protein